MREYKHIIRHRYTQFASFIKYLVRKMVPLVQLNIDAHHLMPELPEELIQVQIHLYRPGPIRTRHVTSVNVSYL